MWHWDEFCLFVNVSVLFTVKSYYSVLLLSFFPALVFFFLKNVLNIVMRIIQKIIIYNKEYNFLYWSEVLLNITDILNSKRKKSEINTKNLFIKWVLFYYLIFNNSNSSVK